MKGNSLQESVNVLKLQIEIDHSLSRPQFQCINISLSQSEQYLFYGMVLLTSIFIIRFNFNKLPSIVPACSKKKKKRKLL